MKKMFKRRFIILLIISFLISNWASLTPMKAAADVYLDMSSGAVPTITTIGPADNDKIYEISSTGAVDKIIIVEPNTEITLVLNGVHLESATAACPRLPIMTTGGQGCSPLQIKDGAKVEIILKDGTENTFISNGTSTQESAPQAGIHVQGRMYNAPQPAANAELTIRGEALGTGKLITKSGAYSAGIGGAADDGYGNITIEGGIVESTARLTPNNAGNAPYVGNGAGIGSGGSRTYNIANSTGIITINGDAKVTAISEGNGAGIGGAGTGSAKMNVTDRNALIGPIIIAGNANVMATSNGNGAGNGGGGATVVVVSGTGDWGNGGPNSTITIGGTANVTAISNGNGAGIGGGGATGGTAGAGGTINILDNPLVVAQSAMAIDIGPGENDSNILGILGTTTIVSGNIFADNVPPNNVTNGTDDLHMVTKTGLSAEKQIEVISSGGDYTYTVRPNGAGDGYLWLANHTVTYDGNGNDSGTEPIDSNNYYIGTAPVTVEAQGSLGKNFHQFTGWNTKADGTGLAYDVGDIEIFDVIDIGTTNVILYAQYVLDTYTIMWDLDGGVSSGTMPASYDALTGVAFPLASTMSKAGYTFSHWEIDGMPLPETEIAIGTTGNKTVKAIWTLDAYTITWDLDGGVSSGTMPANYDILTGVTFPLASTMNKAGYTFSHWELDGVTETGIVVGTTGNKTVEAIWTLDTYTIAWDLDGGVSSGTMPTSYDILTGVTFPLASTMSNPGYTFSHWELDGVPETEIAVGTTGNKTVKAVWTLDAYTIMWDLDGGASSGTMPVNYDILTGVTFPLASTMNKVGYTFSHWELEGVTETGIIAGATGNKTVEAIWTLDTYTIAWDLDGGVSSGTMPANYDILTGVTFPLASTMSKAGYTFSHWELDGVPETEIAVGTTGNKTVKAVWTLDAYTITWDLDGGVSSGAMPANYDILTGVTFPLASTMNKAGYTFSHWEMDGAVETGIIAGTTGNKTVEAIWTLDTYTITWDLDGGVSSGTMPTSYDILTGITFPLASTMNKTGYTFNHWEIDEITADNSGALTFKAIPIVLTSSKPTNIGTYQVVFSTSNGTNKIVNALVINPPMTEESIKAQSFMIALSDVATADFIQFANVLAEQKHTAIDGTVTITTISANLASMKPTTTGLHQATFTTNNGTSITVNVLVTDLPIPSAPGPGTSLEHIDAHDFIVSFANVATADFVTLAKAVGYRITSDSSGNLSFAIVPVALASSKPTTVGIYPATFSTISGTMTTVNATVTSLSFVTESIDANNFVIALVDVTAADFVQLANAIGTETLTAADGTVTTSLIPVTLISPKPTTVGIHQILFATSNGTSVLVNILVTSVSTPQIPQTPRASIEHIDAHDFIIDLADVASANFVQLADAIAYEITTDANGHPTFIIIPIALASGKPTTVGVHPATFVTRNGLGETINVTVTTLPGVIEGITANNFVITLSDVATANFIQLANAIGTETITALDGTVTINQLPVTLTSPRPTTAGMHQLTFETINGASVTIIVLVTTSLVQQLPAPNTNIEHIDAHDFTINLLDVAAANFVQLAGVAAYQIIADNNGNLTFVGIQATLTSSKPTSGGTHSATFATSSGTRKIVNVVVIDPNNSADDLPNSLPVTGEKNQLLLIGGSLLFANILMLLMGVTKRKKYNK